MEGAEDDEDDGDSDSASSVSTDELPISHLKRSRESSSHSAGMPTNQPKTYRQAGI